MAPYKRGAAGAGAGVAMSLVLIGILFAISVLPLLLLFGVLLYMYKQYRKIKEEKEYVMQLQQNYLLAHKTKF
uniref:Uncharacterized protein n=1 Tax=Meloidogyne enterolobii TaxID=390850 RepID=A0A6V7U728_MELEN|nr:unnamed protein product [Meloidogyne enterolobii]CAD2146387.1 unnamed protein product [Meloidogyne enterolobii]